MFYYYVLLHNSGIVISNNNNIVSVKLIRSIILEKYKFSPSLKNDISNNYSCNEYYWWFCDKF